MRGPGGVDIFMGLEQVDKRTFRQAMTRLGLRAQPNEIDQLFDSLDEHGAGTLARSELLGLLQRVHPRETLRERWEKRASSPGRESSAQLLSAREHMPQDANGAPRMLAETDREAQSAVAAASTETEAVNPADCVAKALELGYRFLDCAEFYANEKAVGEGIARSGVPRSELFLASKVWTTTIHKGPEAVQAQLEKTLADLGTDCERI